MERVETLSERLREQIAKNATPDELLLTVQMLQAELQHLKSAGQGQQSVASAVAIHMPSGFDKPEPANKASEPVPEPEEKIIQVLQVDEAELEAELEEIKRNAEARAKISVQNKPPLLFDPIEDTPTLIHQQNPAANPPKEIHEVIAGGDSASLNDALREHKTELSETLQESPIKDLRKGIGINDRFLFISELFRGDEAMYERSIKTINGFSIYPEAEYWIRRELKLKLGWDDKNTVVRQFDQLVKRRFSFT